MKKIITTAVALLVMGSFSFAQDAAKKNDKKEKPKTTATDTKMAPKSDKKETKKAEDKKATDATKTEKKK